MGWIIKMLLKIMKPFAKAMIWQAIFDYVDEWANEEETTSEAPAEESSAEDTGV